MSLSTIKRQIISCERCPRLRAYCARVTRQKRAAYRTSHYWGKPVPGFGDRLARVMVLGLAPAAHGANRTGRVFTGDRSGDFLVRAMHEVGFANQPNTDHARDGLKLKDAYINSVIRCAPPENRPLKSEIQHCSSFLEAELKLLTRVQIVVCLGKVAFDAYWRLMNSRGIAPRPKPRFAHGLVFNETDGKGPSLVASYHPSQQNTNTGRLTAAMLSDIFKTTHQLLR